MQIKAIVCFENIFLCMEVIEYNACYSRRLIRRLRGRGGRVDKVAATQNKTGIFYKTVRTPFPLKALPS